MQETFFIYCCKKKNPKPNRNQAITGTSFLEFFSLFKRSSSFEPSWKPAFTKHILLSPNLRFLPYKNGQVSEFQSMFFVGILNATVPLRHL